MNTHESYVSLETAKLLKEKEFDWEIKDRWDYCVPTNNWKIIHWPEEPRNWNTNAFKFVVSAPTLAVAQRWLREVKEWEAQVAYGFDKDGHKTYVTECGNPEGDLEIYRAYFPIYEEALEAAIKYCLEHLIDVEKSK